MSKEGLNLTPTGSATGNPRNKTALKPGFSLMGWIRLTGSGEDLTGLRGRQINVSHQELAKHNSAEDCWMAVRGKVYNVTRYLEFHPGGAEQLMRGAGKDATSLFDEYHAWVNIDSLLAKCFVGPLRNTATLSIIPDESLMKSPSSKSLLSALSPTRTRPAAAADATIDDEAGSSNKHLSALSLEVLRKKQPTSECRENVPVIPRFDWIQKTTELAIFFYTKAHCNPGLLLRHTTDKSVEVHIFIANERCSYKFTFLKPLKWPCRSARVNCESGKIEIIFEKTLGEIWTNFGTFEKQPSELDCDEEEFSIVERASFNHDSFEMRLRPMNRLMMKMPIGSHVNFLRHVSPMENQIIRSYTPVPSKYYASASASSSPADLLFIIKSYEHGAFSSFLKSPTQERVRLSLKPKGALNLYRIRSCTKFAMLAAGSGITPMYNVVEHLLDRRENRIESLTLFYFNKTESDVWTRQQLQNVVKNDDRFKVEHFYSSPDPPQPSRRLTKELVEEVMKVSEFMFICGPVKFNDLAASYCREVARSQPAASGDAGDDADAFWIFQ